MVLLGQLLVLLIMCFSVVFSAKLRVCNHQQICVVAFLVNHFNLKRVKSSGTLLILILLLNTISSRTVLDLSQPTITCSKLTIETLQQGVKYVQS